jgi:predicted Zn-dependent protease
LAVAVLAALVAAVIGIRQFRTVSKPTKGSQSAKGLSAEVQSAIRRAKACEQAGDETGLERELITLIELQPDEFDWRLMLCRLQCRQGRSSAAVETCQKGLALNLPLEKEAELRIRLADESIKMGDAATARAALEPLIDQPQPHPWTAPLWAKVLRLEGRSDAALEYLRRVLPANHRNASAYQLMGMLEFDQRNYAAALELLRQSARLDPYSDVTQFKLAECARILGDRDAEKSYRDEYARLHALREEIDVLESRYRREHRLNRDEYERLAELNEQIGHSDRSEIWLRKARASP